MHDNNRGVSMLLIVRRCRACVCVCVCAGPVVVLASLSWWLLYSRGGLIRGGCLLERGCSGEQVVRTLHLPRATRPRLEQNCALVLCGHHSALLRHSCVLCELLVWCEGLEAQEVAEHVERMRANEWAKKLRAKGLKIRTELSEFLFNSVLNKGAI